MQLRLVSDFRDYYDHWFDLDGEPFERMATGGMSRPEMLAYLDALGIPTPHHCIAGNMRTQIDDHDLDLGGRTYRVTGYGDTLKVVVYTDDRAHRGEGKRLMTAREAVENYSQAYCSVYQDVPEAAGESVRYLRVGRRAFVYTYRSADDWRSNCGEVEIGQPKTFPSSSRHYFWHGDPQRIPYPLWAIDFVRRQRAGVEPATMPHYVAVDFNLAPGLKGTGIEDILSAREVVDLLKEATASLTPA